MNFKVVSLPLLAVLLSACAHSGKSVDSAQSSPSFTETELFSSPPLTTLDFKEVEQEPVLAPEDSLTSGLYCEDEHLMFLVKNPLEGLEAFQQVYDAALEYNQNLQDLIMVAVDNKVGKISDVDYMEMSSQINGELTSLNESLEPLVQKHSSIFNSSNYLYPLCESRLKEMMTSKKIDENQDGCELEAQSAYILDPYGIRTAIFEGLYVERDLGLKLDEILQTVTNEINGQIPETAATEQFKNLVNELAKSELFKKSALHMDKVFQAFSATLEVKQQCESAHKNHKK